MNCRLGLRGLKSTCLAFAFVASLSGLVALDPAVAAEVRQYPSFEKALTSPASMEAIVDAPMIGFVVDNTGSTQGLLTGVRQAITALIAALPGGVGTIPPQFLLETFNDPLVGEPFVTSSSADLQSAVLGIVPSGGGDCPELAMTGLMRALGAASPRSVLFLFTDADAKDCANSQLVVALARLKNVAIYTIVAGDCEELLYSTAANDAPVSSYRREGRGGTRSSGAAAIVFPATCGQSAYKEVTVQTGGMAFDFSNSNSNAQCGGEQAYLDTGVAEICSITGLALSGTNIKQIPVDASVTQLEVLVEFLEGILTSVVIRKPDGNLLDLNGVDVSACSFSDGLIATIPNPAPGVWQVEIVGGGTYQLNAFARSTEGLTSFEFVTVDAGPTYTPLRVLPSVSSSQSAVLTWSGAQAPLTTQLVDTEGNVLATLSPATAPGLASNQRLVTFVPPATPFRAQILRPDGQSHTSQRVARQLTRATDVVLTSSLVPAQMNANNSYTFRVTVQNLGAARTFDIAADADHRMDSVTTNPEQIALGTNQSATVFVTVDVPLDFLVTRTVNFVVSALDQTRQGNAIVIPVLVLENQPPDCSGAYVIGFNTSHLSYELEPIQFAGIVDPENQPVAVEAFDITQDEPLETNTGASANLTCPDAYSGYGVTYLRNENAMNGDGRIYRGNFTAYDPQGKQCSGTFSFCVPKHHGSGDRCQDDGYRYNSTAVCTRFNFGSEPDVTPAAGPALVALPAGTRVSLSVSGVAGGSLDMQVFDISGRLIEQIWDGPVDSGALEMSWDTSRLGSGIYFIRARVGSTLLVRKVSVSH